MNTLIFVCSLSVALMALALYINKRHRQRQKVIKATTYRPPPQLNDPSMVMTSSNVPAYLHQAIHLSIHQLTASDEKAPPMDPQNTNIDRVAPNDRRLAPVQLPIIIDSAPPPYEAVVC